MQQCAFFDVVVACHDFVDGLRRFAALYVGQEAHAAKVHAENGNLFVADALGCFQEGAVAAEAQGQVGLEIIVGNEGGFGSFHAHFVQKSGKLPVDEKFG